MSASWNSTAFAEFVQFAHEYEEPHYGLFSRCATEFAGSAFVIFMGESIIANELLARTKGHGMGWGAVALGFGFAFGTAIMMFNHISGHFNPAMLIGLCIAGKITVAEVLLSSVCEFAGGFLGAVLVWLHFLPHFKTVPEPPTENHADDLLRTRDYLGTTGQKMVGNKAWVQDHEGGFFKDVKYFLNLEKQYHMPKNKLIDTLLEDLHYHHDVEGEYELTTIVEDSVDFEQYEKTIRKAKSIQVADLHKRLQDLDRKLREASSIRVDKIEKIDELEEASFDAPAAMKSVAGGIRQVEEPDATAKLEYQAALILDQHAKLSVFATRPAVVAPVFNFLCEFMCTTMLIMGALLVGERGALINKSASFMWETQEAFLLGWFVFVCILALGGPTGIAANPMRDCAPRIAHWLLPIPNKGPSEWFYGWIPVAAPLLGGITAGFCFNRINSMNQYIMG